uniref:Uncharacterized protein n=1 Tax=Ditylenchus dipsaci TaxID=166011 RepID=A0A915EUR6_9BILA
MFHASEAVALHFSWSPCSSWTASSSSGCGYSMKVNLEGGSSSNRMSFSVQGSGKKRNGGANRDPVWNFFREEIESNGVVVVRCRECRQVN